MNSDKEKQISEIMQVNTTRSPVNFWLGAICFTAVCVVTGYNTYRLNLLQTEVFELRRKFGKIESFGEGNDFVEGRRFESVHNANDINEDAENKHDILKLIKQQRTKRTIIGATEDGVVVSSESYSHHKTQNRTFPRYSGFKGVSVTPMAAQPSTFGKYFTPRHTISYFEKGQTTQKSPVYIRSSRVMHFEDKSKAFRQRVKTSALKSGDTSMFASNEYTDSAESEFPLVRDEGVVRRRNRNRMETLDERHPRTGRIKPLPTCHFSGDTSRYVYGQHANFNGNGHLRHPQRIFVDWRPNSWMEKTGMNSHFNIQHGKLTIRESGIYFVYAQIYYLDEHDVNGYRVYKNDETILQCTIGLGSSVRSQKGNTCYTAGAEYIAEGDTISLGDISEGRYSLFEPGKSFFGVIKLGDVKARQ